MWHQHAVQAFLIAAVLAPFSYYAGKAANSVRLPQITGYLVSGIICGPYVLSILSQDLVKDLSIIEGACLGIIGLAAGAELQLTELNRHKQQVKRHIFYRFYATDQLRKLSRSFIMPTAGRGRPCSWL